MNPPDLRWNTASTLALNIADHIDVWRVRLHATAPELEQHLALLSMDERKRAQRYHFDQDRDRYIIRRSILRKLIAGYLDENPAALCFDYNEYGKPRIGGKHGEQLQFNLSFSNDLALFAFARDQPIGIDIEKHDSSVFVEDIAKDYFSETESTTLLALPQDQRRSAFYNGWTRKEAWIKARGQGLAIPLQSFTVTLTDDQPARLVCAGQDTFVNDWSMYALAPAADYTAALAVQGKCAPPRLFAWPVVPAQLS